MRELTGLIFHRLTVLGKSSNKTKWKESIWICQCECGKIKEIIGRSLTRGKTKSCGCLAIEKAIQNKTTHNHSKTDSYKSWKAMIQRCNNPNHINYKNYGGNGITICDEWLKFENFYNDMGDRPEGKTLDRKDNTKGYYRDNCQWSDYVTQSHNKRISKFNTSGKTGVRFIKERNYWEARLRYDNKIYIKVGFKTFEDAVDYRKYLEVKYCGKETGH